MTHSEGMAMCWCLAGEYSMVIINPTYNGVPVDSCLSPDGAGCGQPAAQSWCWLQGYANVDNYTTSTAYVAQTAYQNENTFCSSVCISLTSVGCSEPTALGGVGAFSVRLAGPDDLATTTGTGRLQIMSGIWNPVAGSQSGNLTALALVACKQLGYASGIATAYSVYHAPQAYGQLAVNCKGSEANVSACTYGPPTGGNAEVELACVASGGAICLRHADLEQPYVGLVCPTPSFAAFPDWVTPFDYAHHQCSCSHSGFVALLVQAPPSSTTLSAWSTANPLPRAAPRS